MIDKREFNRVFMEAVNLYRKFAPKDTGNLAYNSIKYQWVSPDKFVIYVDTGRTTTTSPRIKGIAPYMPFTNEKWVSPKWNGKVNPNENWWNEATEYIVNYIALRLGGTLK